MARGQGLKAGWSQLTWGYGRARNAAKVLGIIDHGICTTWCGESAATKLTHILSGESIPSHSAYTYLEW